MVRKTGLAAIVLALVAGTIAANSAGARIALNRIALNRIALNGIVANPARADRMTAKPIAKHAVRSRKTRGEGSVTSVESVELPAK